MSARKDALKGCGRFRLHTSCYMPVGVHDKARGGVSQPVGHRPRVDARLDRQRRAGVPERVEGQARQPRSA